LVVAEAGLGKRLLEATDDPVALGSRAAPGDEVVVVQRDAPGADLGEAVDAVHGVDQSADRLAEWIAPGIADRPESEGEACSHDRHETQCES
jgi:hypothetical protein